MIEPLFWDGRAPNLEAQAAGPITAPVEMNKSSRTSRKTSRILPSTNVCFERLFPNDGVTQEKHPTAIATFERTVSPTGPRSFDRWVEGDETAISESAKRGFQIFTGKASCSGCHSGWNFTDNKFHDIGLETDDPGRAAIEPNNIKAQHAFKTPACGT